MSEECATKTNRHPSARNTWSSGTIGNPAVAGPTSPNRHLAFILTATLLIKSSPPPHQTAADRPYSKAGTLPSYQCISCARLTSVIFTTMEQSC